MGIASDTTYATRTSKAGANTYVQVYGQTGYAAEVHVQSQNANGALVAAMDNAGTGYLKTTINTPILFAIENTTKMRLDADGLKFGSDTAAANALDDYEEGTWTPTIIGQSSAGSGTYTNQVGKYTKVGNVVHIHAFLSWSAHTGSGIMFVGALPFTAVNTSLVIPSVVVNSSDMTFNGTQISGVVGANTTQIQLVNVASDTAIAGINMDTAVGGLYVTGHYYTA